MTHKHQTLIDHVKTCCHAREVVLLDTLQSVWSGYGQLLRAHITRLSGEPIPVVIKHVTVPTEQQHPRGWQSDFAHQRKMRSYEVEAHWYQHYPLTVDSRCTMPSFFGAMVEPDQRLLVIGDLTASGFGPVARPNRNTLLNGLTWLARFHASTLGRAVPKTLWPQGNYWHLATRPDEFEAMPASPLKTAATAISNALTQARYRCWIHGDAKVANFCEDRTGSVAALDFQYIGGGIGVEDVVYFIGSIVSGEQLLKVYDELLEHYFEQFRQALTAGDCGNAVEDVAPSAIETEWRELLPMVWADFQRFLEGWSPQHHKNHLFGQRQTAIALSRC